MSHAEIEELVSEFRKSIYNISDEDVEDVLELCRRKIEIVGQLENYMELLLTDELKNHCFRMAVNATTILRRTEKEGLMCAQCAGAIPV